jgi:alpha-L-fucosidase 2
MKRQFLLLLSLLLIKSTMCQAQVKQPSATVLAASNDIKWHTLGNDENSSMPLGNGDIAANVWTEKNGDIVLLIAKSDAWAETASLLKLGRVRVKLTPNPFADTAGFTQALQLENGMLEIKRGANKILVWIDANHPVIHVQAALATAGTLSAGLEMWRKAQSVSDSPVADPDFSLIMSGDRKPKLKPDFVFPVRKNRLAWCHYNADSFYPYILKQQHLESLTAKFPDPLYQRCFGALLTGPGLVKQDDRTLKSSKPAKQLQVDIVALTDTKSASPASWNTRINVITDAISKYDIRNLRLSHKLWWSEFWNRSWIHVTGTDDAQKVSQGYAMQRYMMAVSSRGESAVKFNGGLFTVGHDMAEGVKQKQTDHDPDFREWGESYWNQNNRLLYWPLVMSGDNDLLKPWFGMYLNHLDFAKARNFLYNYHDGASFPETMEFWAVPRMDDFGENNPTNEIQSHWQRYHVQGTLEIIAEMLDQYDYYGSKAFSRSSVVPFADAIITYYDKHWQRDAKGKIYMYPMQSLETYQLNAANPTPDIAGLMSVIPRLISLPHEMTTRQQRDNWSRVLSDLPPLPLGKTVMGKIPSFGEGDADGMPVILPAEKYGNAENSENPELYTTFPYRIYGVGKPNLQLALNTFAARRFPQNTCWGQDGTQASILGLTDVAKKAAIAEFINYGDERFPWFWKAGHDWIPDFDNGGSGMITLQNMLMQCDGKRIQLTPAWPADWTADFKLHAPGNTTVEGHVQKGKLSNLRVIPASRTKDVVVVASNDLSHL